METGPFIKLQRIKQGMTQEELAEGIVSMSYLSKIENQKTDPSQEVISLLCTRLGVQRDDDKEITIKEKCQEWYDLLFVTNDRKVIVEKYQELENLLNHIHSDNLILFEIHRIRYYLVLQEIDKALEQINRMNEVSTSFDTLHQFYWYKFKGNYNSTIREYNQAMRMYKLAEEKLNQIKIAEEYEADLQYTISITHSKLRNTLESIEYANKAIDTFQMQYNFIRCAQCHIVLGISYRRIGMYEKAIKNQNLAKHLGEINQNKQIVQLANQNLGYLYTAKGETKEAIYYYNQVIDDDIVNAGEKLAAITSLIREYYKIFNIDKTKEMIKAGQEILELNKKDDSYKLFRLIILTYQYAVSHEFELFESTIINEFIPYLKKNKDYANVVVYASMLAAHYEKLSKYKDSVKYYKVASLAYEELINL
ncbi:helix-turn-helix domain-containing protein [Virgibacillus flavescens]|uniref:helix-turn-helix domain-containing protein n=1 Tax=Virgibacillus flavescens TaxID=1611422 RepID=UPI003D33366D